MNSLYKQTKFMMHKLHKLLFPPLKTINKNYQFDRHLKI